MCALLQLGIETYANALPAESTSLGVGSSTMHALPRLMEAALASMRALASQVFIGIYVRIAPCQLSCATRVTLPRKGHSR
jgi:hypothetical protein